MRTRALTPLLFALTLPTVAAAAETPELVKLTAGIKRYYSQATDFRARFTQTTRTKFEPGATDELEGTLYVKRPGLLRWEYAKAADGPLVVCDGKSLYQYDAFDNVVEVVREFSSNNLTAALAFLWGEGDLAAEFDLARYSGTETYGTKGDAVLRLTPKKQPSQFKELILVVAPKTHQVRECAWSDAFGGTNHLRFLEASINNKLDAKLFTFTPPKGAEVIERAGGAP